MTTPTAAVAPPPTARRYSEQLTTLVEEQARAYVLGKALEAAEDGGYTKPREAEVTRALLDEALARTAVRDPEGHARAVRRGRAELEHRRNPKPVKQPRQRRAPRA
jgi:hypothetical protein